MFKNKTNRKSKTKNIYEYSRIICFKSSFTILKFIFYEYISISFLHMNASSSGYPEKHTSICIKMKLPITKCVFKKALFDYVHHYVTKLTSDHT